MRRPIPWLLAVAFVAFVGLGLPDGLLGTGWPAMRAEFGRPLGDLGALVSLTIISYGLAASVVGTAVRRAGTGGVLVTAYVLISLGIAVVVTSFSFATLSAGMFALSAGNGLLDPAMNAYVARAYGPRTMNLLHASFGLGATLGPIVMVAALARTGDWRYGYLPVLVFGVVMTVGMAATRRRWASATSVAAPTDRPSIRSVLPSLIAFGLVGGTEVAAGQWAFSLATEAKRIDDVVAAGFVAAFWGAFTAGRVIGAIWGNRIPPQTLLRVAPWVAAVALAWLAAIPGRGAILALPIVGLGMSVTFPTLVTVTSRRYPEDADAIIGWAFTAMSVGVGLGPLLVGEAADVWGANALGIGLVVMGLAVAAVVPALGRDALTKGEQCGGHERR